METIEEVISAYPEVTTVDQAALFLSQIAPEDFCYLETLTARFPSPEAFAIVIWKNPRLLKHIQSCHREKDFTSFWGLFRGTDIFTSETVPQLNLL
jgi:hypothetical protein